MFIEVDEMKTTLYEYQMAEIAESDISIIEDGIAAAVSEVRSYFEAANNRRETANLNSQQYAAWKMYDVDAIFGAAGNDRNKFVTRLCKRVAAYNICELANPDIIYQHVLERYENTIKTLEKIAGMGEYANARIILSDLPSPTPQPEPEAEEKKPFRMISRPKFNHE